MITWIFISIAGLIAGAVNSAAGGGSFITFPALMYAGLPPVVANASSTVALLPGAIVSAHGYRAYRKPFPGVSWAAMVVLTLVGGFIGAMLLLASSTTAFNALVPWLLLTGALAFAFGKQLGNVLRRYISIGSRLILSAQFLLGIYAGYFGGAVGIMMMAVWSLFGLADIRVINANKTYFVAIGNVVAIVLFIAAKKVCWPETLVMMLSTIIGSYLGTYYAKKLDPVILRRGVVIFNFIIVVLFFYKTYR